MVSFGRLTSKSETLSRESRYASTPLDVPGNLYTGRRRTEVDANGDLDELIQQEMQRYEELFQSQNHLPNAPGDDDTLLSGSVYTSMPATSTRFPAVRLSASQDDEDTMLEAPSPRLEPSLKVASNSLPKPGKQVPAKVGTITKDRSDRKPPLASIPLQDTTSNKELNKLAAVDTPTPFKKKKFKPSFPKRFLGKGNGSVLSKNPNLTTSASQPASVTHSSASAASTAPKMNFFSPVRFLKPSKSLKQQKRHQNLLLASMAPAKPFQKEEKPRPSHPLPSQQLLDNIGILSTTTPSMSPSHPPPIDHCEIRYGDGASACSGQSSLTDVPDTWIVNTSPPNMIGGASTQDVSPFKSEQYNGGPIVDDDTDRSVIDKDNEDDQVTAASPGGLLLTADGLYFHNHHGKVLSTVRASGSITAGTSGDVIQDNLVQMVWANKEQQEFLKEAKALAQEDIHPDAADVRVVKILGLKSIGAEIDYRSTDVNHNIFEGGNDPDLDVSLAPLEQVVTPEDDHVMAEQPIIYAEDTREDQGVLEVVLPQHQQQKPSKFKRFLSKLVNSPKMKQLQQEAELELQRDLDRAQARDAKIEQLRQEQEETERIEQKRRLELERQRKLELGSQSLPSNTSQTGSASSEIEECPARSFSLFSGQMTVIDKPGSQTSFMADITSFQTIPTVQTAPSSNPSMAESPMPTSYLDDVAPVTPKSSYLVNFQFHRQEGDKSFSMAYSVDSLLQGLKWKDIVNEAWKEDRRVIKSGVFSAIGVDNIKRIQDGQLEMRFELPLWGKHASQTLGPKTLDVLLDVVGPHRPVQVTITLEEPLVAAGVEDDGAPACLF